jgi:hypothetical protein
MNLLGLLKGRRSGTDRRQRQAAFLFAKSERRLGFQRRSPGTRLSNAIAFLIRLITPDRRDSPPKRNPQ